MTDNQQTPQSASGSSENQGRSRQEQMPKPEEMPSRIDMANEIGVNQDHLASQQDLGAGSGRDDYAGGSGDAMENESTGEDTDR